jgi:cysteine-rich repeat protein
MLPLRYVALVGLVACTGGTDTASSGINSSAPTSSSPLRGAIFTTTVDGTRVDANIYAAKTDVYLDGGPGPNAPSGAAALPPGDYYFQVTDPSGHTLLSSDAVTCREITIGADGFIVADGAGACAHATGVDSDYGSSGAITVQLMPYADTPNHGGEYKVWVTRVADYAANGGFANRASKTDNFKVRNQSEAVCGNGIVEMGEQCDDGNTVNGDGCSSTCQLEHAVCGNGVVETGEQCDDGNTVSGDGCSSTCQLETTTPCCGNGIIEAGEQCDDGNTVGGDGCSSTCQLEYVSVMIAWPGA